MTLSDTELLELVRNGRPEAFDVLVDRYRPRLLRFAAQSFSDAAIADDLVQETFTAVFTARDSFNPAFAFSTWIWTILLNLCRRERRKRRTDLRSWAEAAERFRSRDLAVEDATATIEKHEDAQRLREMLDTLPTAQADALRLRFFAELTFDEIAAAMDSSVSGAKVRVRKGLEALAQRLQPNDSKPLAGAIVRQPNPEPGP